MIPRPRNRVSAVAALLLLATAGLTSQRGGMELTFSTPASLAQVADRVRDLDRQDLASAVPAKNSVLLANIDLVVFRG